MTAKLITGLFLMTLALLAGCAAEPLVPEPQGPTAGWEVMRPNPAGQTLTGVWSDGPDNVWGVGNLGTIVHWNGERTLEVDSPTADEISSIDGWSAHDLYAAASRQILHFDGRTWEVHSRGERGAFNDVLCGPDGHLYSVGTEGIRVFQGGSWRIIAGPEGPATTLWIGPDQLVRAGEGGRVWVVENGKTQLELELPNLGIEDGDGRYLIARNETGQYLLFTWSQDSGWSRNEGAYFSVRAVLDRGDYVASDNSGLWTSSDQLWRNTLGRWIFALNKVGDRDFVAAGSSGTLLYCSPDSLTGDFVVTENYQGLGYSLVGCLTGTSDQDIWAGERLTRVLHYDGSRWHNESTPLPYATVQKIQVFGEGWVAATASNGLALRRPDTGHWSDLADAPVTISHMQCISPDSILIANFMGYQLWNGTSWLDLEARDGLIGGLTRTAGGALYSLEKAEGTTLKMWDGAGFESVLDIPGFQGQHLLASRASDTLWLVGHMNTSESQSVVFRYREGVLAPVSEGVRLPQPLTGMVDHGADDFFLLGPDALWRFHDDLWTVQQGLPENDYFGAIWSSPEGGVYVQGHSLFYKNYAQE
nr:hypothetical protein [Candidatus Krumholzibacteria bacterium]